MFIYPSNFYVLFYVLFGAIVKNSHCLIMMLVLFLGMFMAVCPVVEITNLSVVSFEGLKSTKLQTCTLED